MKNSFQVICHDDRSILSATITEVSEGGGELLIKADHANPVFAIKSKIFLDILDETTGESMQVHARLAQAVRQDRQWTYLVRWQECPSILKNLLKSAA